jgi:hypothetical protein
VVLSQFLIDFSLSTNFTAAFTKDTTVSMTVGVFPASFYVATDSVRCLFYISSPLFIDFYSWKFTFLKRFKLSFGRHPAIIFIRRQFCFYMSSHFTTCQRTSGQYMLLSRNWSSAMSFFYVRKSWRPGTLFIFALLAAWCYSLALWWMFLVLGLLVFVPTKGCNFPSVHLKCNDILFVCLFVSAASYFNGRLIH